MWRLIYPLLIFIGAEFVVEFIDIILWNEYNDNETTMERSSSHEFRLNR